MGRGRLIRLRRWQQQVTYGDGYEHENQWPNATPGDDPHSEDGIKGFLDTFHDV